MINKTILSYILLACILAGCYNKAEDEFIQEQTTATEDQKSIDEKIAQNKWIFQQMNQNYYWYKDMPDSSSLNFESSSTAFFDRLLSASDRFSWIEPNSDYSGSSMFDKYGIVFQTYQTKRGAKINRVLQIVPGSPAALAGIKRGDWFKANESEDGVVLNVGALYKDNFIARQEFVLQDNLKSAQTRLSVSVDSVYNINGVKIGYMVYDQFDDDQGLINNEFRVELRDVFSRFQEAGISCFIIDLRYNPGGFLSICQYLCSLILSDEYLGKVSGYHEFNEKLAQQQLYETGNKEEVLTFPAKTFVGGRNIGMPKIYAIVTNRTASASECLINSLKPYIEVVVVGTTTVGKGVGSWTIKDNRYKWQLQPITFRYYNALHQTVPDSGLIPDIYADESLAENLYELGDTNEFLLHTVLQSIVSGETKSAIIHEKQLSGLTPVVGSSNDYKQRRVHGYIDINH